LFVFVGAGLIQCPFCLAAVFFLRSLFGRFLSAQGIPLICAANTHWDYTDMLPTVFPIPYGQLPTTPTLPCLQRMLFWRAFASSGFLRVHPWTGLLSPRIKFSFEVLRVFRVSSLGNLPGPGPFYFFPPPNYGLHSPL